MVVEIVQAILRQLCTLVKPRFGLGRDGGGPGMYPFFFFCFLGPVMVALTLLTSFIQ